MNVREVRHEITRILTAIDTMSEEFNEEEIGMDYDPDNTMCVINRRINDAYAALCEVDDLLLEL
jgi:hypothetical protein